MAIGSTPLVGFHFNVLFQFQPQMDVDGNFQSINGLKVTLETESVAEGGQNRFKHQLPLRTSYQDLVLKRGMVSDFSTINKWFRLAMEDYTFIPISIVITLMNGESEIVKSWFISHAIPLSYEVGEFNAEENRLLFETLTLRYNHFREITL